MFHEHQHLVLFMPMSTLVSVSVSHSLVSVSLSYGLINVPGNFHATPFVIH